MRAPTVQQSLLIPAVTLDISFAALLGDNRNPLHPIERRARWAQWLRLARSTDRTGARYWQDKSECSGCIHLQGSWCGLAELPVTVNPVPTYKGFGIGMACAGTGRREGAAA